MRLCPELQLAAENNNAIFFYFSFFWFLLIVDLKPFKLWVNGKHSIGKESQRLAVLGKKHPCNI